MIILISVVLTCLPLLGVNGVTPNCSTTPPTSSYSYPSNVLDGYYKLAVGVVNGLHSGAPPYSNIIKVYNATTSGDASQLKSEILALTKSQAGFIAFLVIGFSFVLLMPLIGCCVCCCRMCDNCGGKMEQRDPSCTCCSLLVVLSLIVVIMMTVGIALFIANSNQAKLGMNTTGDIGMSQLDSLNDFIKYALDSIFCQLNTLFNNVFDTVASILDDAGNDVTNVYNNISGLDLAQQSVDHLKGLRTMLQSQSSSLQAVWVEANNLNLSISQFYSDSLTGGIDTNISMKTGSTIELAVLENSSQIISNNIQQAVTSISNTLNSTNIEQSINDIKANLVNVSDTIKNKVQDAKIYLVNAKTTVQEETDRFQNVSKAFQNTTTHFVNDIRKSVDDINLWIKNPENHMQAINWYISSLITPVILSVLLVVLGLLSGAIGYRNSPPPNRSIVSHHGGNCLLASAGFMFIFSWILMVVCILVFCVGYVTQLVCFSAFQDPKLALYDVLQQEYPVSFPINGHQQSFNIKDIYENCQANQALYKALQLQNVINFTEIESKLLSIDIPMDLLDANINDTLTNSTWLSNSTVTSLTTLLSDLDKQLQMSVAMLNAPSLKNTQAYIDHAKPMVQNKTVLNDQLNDIQLNATNMDEHVLTIKDQFVNITEAFKQTRSVVWAALNSTNNIQQIQGDVIRTAKSLMDRANETITSYANALEVSLMEDIAKCKPLITLWTGFGYLTCKTVAYPIQGLWLGLGWCLLFFIPSTILFILLSKYLRVMDSNVSTNNEMHPDHWAMPKYSTKPTKPMRYNNGYVGPANGENINMRFTKNY